VRVLLLEDEKHLQKATARLIQHTFGPGEVTIDVTDTAPGAIELLQQNSYDFTLSDYSVTRGTGGDVLLWIQDNQPHMVERFVFFSGAKDLDLIHHKVIVKGVSVEEFVVQLLGYVVFPS
jgi:CheY-like chemotaxis protein